MKKNRKGSKGTRTIRIDKNTWIETREDQPDEVLRNKFLQKWPNLTNIPRNIKE